ncbi:hypothetical protein ILUMI_23805 [Ignelater luminosus]|uniref:DDE-1 domain-containing protein n=1 Tax=Ignelater luminosus TaxID=2038154 RepID=A0A8K0CEQ0_IGNLU|nr:hypothetical protein ILUMI_23805 [Ignelater luminosus]
MWMRLVSVWCNTKGKRQIGAIASQERGHLVTVVTRMNVTGVFVPPMLIFLRKEMKFELKKGTPTGTIFDWYKSGWIQSNLFVEWLQHFISHTLPTRESPVLLLLDGHYTHTRNLFLIELARYNFVHIVSLPSHSIHRMQPLDIGFMSSFKTFYGQEIKTWLRSNPG